MIFKITKVEPQNKDWYKVSGVSEDGMALDGASVNRVSQKGEVFPGFDDIVVGAQVNGTLWVNQTGKQYLFAPRAEKAGKGNVAQMMEKKQYGIEKAQDKKAGGIMTSSTARDATLITTALLHANAVKPTEWQDKWLEVRGWLLNNWDGDNEIPF